MGSKSPYKPGSKAISPTDEPDRDASTAALLQRIADTLQIPPSALYAPPDASHVAPCPDSDMVDATDDECAALLHAFKRIRDGAERHRLLTLVQIAAAGT